MSHVNGDNALDDIRLERERQDARWGEQNHPDGTGDDGLVMVAALRRRQADSAAKKGTLTWRLILAEEVAEAFAESDVDKLRAELVQVAAVATAWVEHLDRRGWADAHKAMEAARGTQ